MTRPRVLVEPLLPLDERYLRSRTVARTMLNMGVCVVEGTRLRGPDGSLDLDAIRTILAGRVGRVPRYRHRLMHAPLGLTGPAWVEDEAFDVDRHLVVVPGVFRGADELVDLVTRMRARPMDLDRPAWDVVVADLGDDVAVTIRAHHVVGDGMFGVTMIKAFMLEEPTDPQLEAAPFEPRAPRGGAQLVAQVGLQWALRRRGIADAVADYRRKSFRKRVRRTIGRNIRGPREAWVAKRRPQLLAVPPRELRCVRLPLPEVKAAARELGGSVNDLLVAAVAPGLTAMALGEPTPGRTARVLVPISGRAAGERTAAGNMVRTTTLDLPLGVGVAQLLPRVNGQIRSALRGDAPSDGAAGHDASVSMLAISGRPLFFAESPVRSVDFVPSVDPTDRLTVFASVYCQELVVWAVAHADLGAGLDAFTETLAAAMTAVTAANGSGA